MKCPACGWDMEREDVDFPSLGPDEPGYTQEHLVCQNPACGYVNLGDA